MNSPYLTEKSATSCSYLHLTRGLFQATSKCANFVGCVLGSNPVANFNPS